MPAPSDVLIQPDMQVDHLALLAPHSKETLRPRDGVGLVEYVLHAASIAVEGKPGPVSVEVLTYFTETQR